MASGRAGANGSLPTVSWRDLFDAVERPIAAGAEAWVQSETFMDALALTWKLQRRALRAAQGVAAPGWCATSSRPPARATTGRWAS